MKKHLLASFALLAMLGGSAMAADLPVKAKPAPVCPGCDWSGFYIGFNVGGSVGWDRTDNAVVLLPTGVAATTSLVNPISALSSTRAPAGAVGGGQVGFNWQTGSWVFGLEADWDASGQRDNIASTAWLASGVLVTASRISYSDEQKIKWLATARARLGWAHDCFLWYVTGGAAWGGLDSNYSFQVVDFVGTVFGTLPTVAGFSSTRSGWTIGGGVETSLAWFGIPTNNWSAKLEYLYVDLGSVTNTFVVPVSPANGNCPGCTYTFTSSSRIRDNIIRVGVNYRFGGYGPAARY
jgi:outer membrane immunogenic protein